MIAFFSLLMQGLSEAMQGFRRISYTHNYDFPINPIYTPAEIETY